MKGQVGVPPKLWLDTGQSSKSRDNPYKIDTGGNPSPPYSQRVDGSAFCLCVECADEVCEIKELS